MSIETNEQIKLELAAKQLIEVVGNEVGRMIFEAQIVYYGNTQKKREKIYKTLEEYGYRWQQGHWQLEVPEWINELVADSWYHHEATRD